MQPGRGDHGVAPRLSGRYEQEEAPEPHPCQTGDHGQGIADDWEPGHEKRPDAIAVESSAGLARAVGIDREPATALILSQEPADGSSSPPPPSRCPPRRQARGLPVRRFRPPAGRSVPLRTIPAGASPRKRPRGRSAHGGKLVQCGPSCNATGRGRSGASPPDGDDAPCHGASGNAIVRARGGASFRLRRAGPYGPALRARRRRRRLPACDCSAPSSQ